MSSKKNGLLALIGLSALAYWRYKNSSEEEKKAIHKKIHTAKHNLTKASKELKSKANHVASQVQKKTEQLAKEAESTLNTLKKNAEKSKSTQS